MKNLLYCVSLNDVWELIKSPKFIIVYMAIMVILMLLIVVAAMINEKRLASLNEKLEESLEKVQSKERASRFEMLKAIDEKMLDLPEKQFSDDVTLKSFCEQFRAYAANKLNLYYDISIIREFVSGLAVSHFIILQGMSGTGKTSLAFALGEFIDNPSLVVPVQPMWKERSDLIGYYNEFTKRFNETPLLQKMYEANLNKGMFVTILDELNIARVEYYFAEFLSLMEIPDPELRYLEIVPDKWDNDPQGLKNGSIKLPENMWFLGTANNDDSTFAISDKVYDRTMIIDLDQKSDAFVAPEVSPVPISAQHFRDLAKEACKNPMSKQNVDKLEKLDAYINEKFHISFGNRIMRQIKTYLPVYVSCGGSELDALDDILAKKVLRKLAMQNMSYRRGDADELISFIDSLFGEGKMTRSIAYIRSLVK